MKLHFNSKIALLYPGEFAQKQELETLLTKHKVELHTVAPEALELPLAALAGYVDAPVAARAFEGEAPTASCLVLSGLSEETLNRVLAAVKEAGIGLTYKAVVTTENRNWAFGALMQEMAQENAPQ